MSSSPTLPKATLGTKYRWTVATPFQDCDGKKAAERRKICSPWRKPSDQGNANNAAPEERNINVLNVPPLRG